MDNTAYFKMAADEARKSPCTRGRGGAIIVHNDVVIGRGYNAPPQNDAGNAKCHLDQRTSRKPKSDRTCCVHAEWRALTDALKSGNSLAGADLYFAGIDTEGNMRFSGAPYCTVCSRLALDLGIARFGLWHESGIVMYDTKTYNNLSYAFHEERGAC
jgi:deoxycytidylate deaminase